MDNPVSQGVNPVTPQVPPPPVTPSAPPPMSPPHQSHNASTPSGTNKKKAGLFAVLAAVVLLAAVGVTVFLGQQEQDPRQQAQTAGKCGPLPSDTLIVFDKSNSMKQAATASVQALENEDNGPSDILESQEESDPPRLLESEDEAVAITLTDDETSTPSATPTGNPTGSPTIAPTATTAPTATSVPTSTPTNTPTSTPPNFPPTNTPVPTGGAPTATSGPIPTVSSGPIPTVPFPPQPEANKQYSGATKLAKAKAAMTHYVDLVSKGNKGSRVSLITFAAKGKTDMILGDNFSVAKSEINAIKTSGGTCISCGVNLANEQLDALTPTNSRMRAIILVTDGRANRVVRNGKSVSPGKGKSEEAALNAAVAGYERHGVPYYVIGLGVNANQDFLKKIANQTNGKYFYSPTEDQLIGIFQEIENSLGKGKVSGQVFIDKNQNGAKDPGEQLLPGWKVKLVPVDATTSSVTDNSVDTLGKKGKHKGKHKGKKKNKGKTFQISCEPDSITANPGEEMSVEVLDKNGKPAANRPVIWSANVTPKNAVKIANQSKTDKEGIATNTIGANSNQNASGTITARVPGDNAATCQIAVGSGSTSTPTSSVTNTPSDPTPTGMDDDDSDDDDGDEDPEGTLTAVTDKDGNYGFTGVCDGDYELVLDVQPGWTVTMPPGNEYAISVVKRSSHTDKDFGVFGAPITTGPTTLTPTGPTGVTGNPSGITLNVEVFMHSIGISGDNSNPFPPQCVTNTSTSTGTGCLSNKSPLHQNRPFDVEIFGVNTTQSEEQTPLAQGTGTLSYNSAKGNFGGSVNLTTPLSPGSYVVKIKSPKYLKKTFPGIIQINQGQNTLPVVSMVVGDSYTEGTGTEGSFNRLDIRDYNALLGCFSLTAPPKDCGFIPNQKEFTDLNDDGQVNDADYNLFIRELAVQQGD